MVVVAEREVEEMVVDAERKVEEMEMVVNAGGGLQEDGRGDSEENGGRSELTGQMVDAGGGWRMMRSKWQSLYADIKASQ